MNNQLQERFKDMSEDEQKKMVSKMVDNLSSLLDSWDRRLTKKEIVLHFLGWVAVHFVVIMITWIPIYMLDFLINRSITINTQPIPCLIVFSLVHSAIIVWEDCKDRKRQREIDKKRIEWRKTHPVKIIHGHVV